MRLWLKFELLELETIFDALNARSQVEKAYIEKKEQLREDV